jgi:hypothetical protein
MRLLQSQTGRNLLGQWEPGMEGIRKAKPEAKYH